MRGKKQKRNLAGLRNQPKLASLALDNSQAPPPSRSADPSSTEDDDPAWELCERDSLRPNWEESDESVHEDDGEVEWNSGWLDLGEEEKDLHASLLRFAMANGDDPRDEDWVPKSLRRKRVGRLMDKKGVSKINITLQ
jgi:hypothetical protein